MRYSATSVRARAQRAYRIIINDPVEVSRSLKEGIAAVRAYRKQPSDAYYFN